MLVRRGVADGEGTMMDSELNVMPIQEWVFRGRTKHVVDGDTVDVEIDAGFHSVRTERLRLLNINAPEVHGPTRQAGLAATTYTAEWLSDATSAASDSDWPLIVETHKSDVFGRYLALVWRTSDGNCLNIDLLASGNAREDIR
jgi:micrococcal nuclease